MNDPVGYQARFQQRCSWYRASFTESNIEGASGCTIRMAVQLKPEPRALIAFVTGRTEFIEKYIELAQDLQHERFSLCLYDHCGQGGSGRLLADREKGHIGRFSDYVRDLDLVITVAAGGNRSIPIFLVCHSMGAAVAAWYCAMQRNRIEKLVLSSPMFGIRTGVYLPQGLVAAVVAAACRFGFGERYVPTTGPFNGVQPFAGNVLTSDEDRFLYNLYLTNRLEYGRFGGPTFHWLNEAFCGMRAIRQSRNRIDCPVIVFAGSRERVVDLREIRRFASNLENCLFKEYDEGRHELFMEKDHIRDDVLTSIKDFLKS